MKVGGVEITKPEDEVLVFPRPGGDLVFKIRAIPDWDEFHKLCPEPTPSAKIMASGERQLNVESPDYKAALQRRDLKKVAWMVVKSLEPSDITWDTVVLENPDTWLNWESDLRDAGLKIAETNRIFQEVMDTNCLNEEKLKAARASFAQRPQEE